MAIPDAGGALTMCALWQTAVALMESLTWVDLVVGSVVVLVITSVVERLWITRLL